MGFVLEKAGSGGGWGLVAGGEPSAKPIDTVRDFVEVGVGESFVHGQLDAGV